MNQKTRLISVGIGIVYLLTITNEIFGDRMGDEKGFLE